MAPPSELQADHGPACGAVCQMCHRAPSVPRTNTSSRPSLFTATAGLQVMDPASELQADHGPACAAVCQMCHKAVSVPTPKISNRPSVLHAAAHAELRAT